MSEISDFLDLDDEMLGELDFFDGVDCFSNEEIKGVNRMFESEEIKVERNPPGNSIAPVPLKEAPKKQKSSGRRKPSTNHICDVCKKSFQQLGHLRSHYLLHTGRSSLRDTFVAEVLCSEYLSYRSYRWIQVGLHRFLLITSPLSSIRPSSKKSLRKFQASVRSSARSARNRSLSRAISFRTSTVTPVIGPSPATTATSVSRRAVTSETMNGPT